MNGLPNNTYQHIREEYKLLQVITKAKSEHLVEFMAYKKNMTQQYYITETKFFLA